MITNFCVFCGEDNDSKLENHHIIPKIKGGTDDKTNLLTLCCNCHGKLHEVRRPNNLRELSKIGKQKAKLIPKRKINKRKLAYLITKNEVQFCIFGEIIDVSKYLKMSRRTFYRLLHNDYSINNRTKITPEIKQKAKELYSKNINKTKISNILGITRKTLLKILTNTHKEGSLIHSIKIETIF